MAKVTQMLDNGWSVELFRNELGTYTAVGQHENEQLIARIAELNQGLCEIVDEDGDVVTDDFTPEQALTRLAYKVHGEILNSQPSERG